MSSIYSEAHDWFVGSNGCFFTAPAGLRSTFRGALDAAVAIDAHVRMGSGDEDVVTISIDAS